jgi:hypothetical protein
MSRHEVNELFLWEFVSNVNYPDNHKDHKDLEHCRNYFQMFPVYLQTQICDEKDRLNGDLYDKYNKLDTGYNSFDDALSFAVSLGKYEYYTILKDESYFVDYLLKYNNKDNGFCESFDYVFQIKFKCLIKIIKISPVIYEDTVYRRAKNKRIDSNYYIYILYPFTEFGEIYIITGPDGKIYVGQTKDTSIERFKQHLWESKNEDGGNCTKLNNALNCHGKENFKLEVLLACPSYLLDFYEEYFIKLYNSLSKFGYNLKGGGKHGKPTTVTLGRQKVSKTGEKNHNYGVSPPIEIRMKISSTLIDQSEKRFSHLEQELPRHVKYTNQEDREGYEIKGHPVLGPKSRKYFTVIKDGNDGNLENCLTFLRFLDTLIPGKVGNSYRLKIFRLIQKHFIKQKEMIKKLNIDLVNKIALIGNKMI